jgi:hypothetical protein
MAAFVRLETIAATSSGVYLQVGWMEEGGFAKEESESGGSLTKLKYG